MRKQNTAATPKRYETAFLHPRKRKSITPPKSSPCSKFIKLEHTEPLQNDTSPQDSLQYEENVIDDREEITPTATSENTLPSIPSSASPSPSFFQETTVNEDEDELLNFNFGTTVVQNRGSTVVDSTPTRMTDTLIAIQSVKKDCLAIAQRKKFSLELDKQRETNLKENESDDPGDMMQLADNDRERAVLKEAEKSITVTKNVGVLQFLNAKYYSYTLELVEDWNKELKDISKNTLYNTCLKESISILAFQKELTQHEIYLLLHQWKQNINLAELEEYLAKPFLLLFGFDWKNNSSIEKCFTKYYLIDLKEEMETNQILNQRKNALFSLLLLLIQKNPLFVKNNMPFIINLFYYLIIIYHSEDFENLEIVSQLMNEICKQIHFETIFISELFPDLNYNISQLLKSMTHWIPMNPLSELQRMFTLKYILFMFKLPMEQSYDNPLEYCKIVQQIVQQYFKLVKLFTKNKTKATEMIQLSQRDELYLKNNPQNISNLLIFKMNSLCGMIRLLFPKSEILGDAMQKGTLMENAIEICDRIIKIQKYCTFDLLLKNGVIQLHSCVSAALDLFKRKSVEKEVEEVE